MSRLIVQLGYPRVKAIEMVACKILINVWTLLMANFSMAFSVSKS